MKQHVPLPEEHVASVMRVASLSNVANVDNLGSVNLVEHTLKPTPSGEMGLPVEKENEWKRLAIHFIICVGQKLHMGPFAIATAIDFLHRFYAQRSMITNDRMLISMACLCLAGKVADVPKRTNDIIRASVKFIGGNDALILCTPDWMEAMGRMLVKAERSLLYLLGFRFEDIPSPAVVIKILSEDESVKLLIETTSKSNLDPELKMKISNIAYQFALSSSKVPLTLQYSQQAIGAVCVWLAMKMLVLDTASMRDSEAGKPWYFKYGLESQDIKKIADTISDCVKFERFYAMKLQSGEELDISCNPGDHDTVDNKLENVENSNGNVGEDNSFHLSHQLVQETSGQQGSFSGPNADFNRETTAEEKVSPIPHQRDTAVEELEELFG